jgi:hypothetical protein
VHGHPGINRTIQIVEHNYWWPQLRRDVKDYIQGCADCQQHKVNNRPTKAPLRPIYPKPEAMPFETIALDFITKLPESQGYDSILTVTDHDCTKAAIFIPCRKKSMLRAQQHSTSNMCLHTLDYHGRSSAIETPDLCQNSCKKCVVSQELSETRPQHIIQELMGSRNVLINGSRLLSDSSSTTIKQIGLLIFPLPNSHITIGLVTPQGSLHSSF